MGNFITVFNEFHFSNKKGIPFGTGLEKITIDTNGLQKSRIYGVAGPQKSGKSTFADYAFLLGPYLYTEENPGGQRIIWDYYSFEISRIDKEFDFMAFFINNDFGIFEIKLPEGITRKGKDHILLDSDYLKGIMLDDNSNVIKLDPQIYDYIKITYERRIIPLFGEYDEDGNKISNGLVNFKEGRDNPTGIYKDIIADAEACGTIHKVGSRYVSYKPNNPDIIRVVIIDHLRKIKPERGWQMKQTIDKMSEYMVELRNLLGYTFVPILHTNRNLTSGDKSKFLGQDIYPTADDLKDSGNLAEDCNYLFTVFNPNDDKYGLKKHFGFDIKDSKGRILYPTLRSIHLVESRHCEFPKHYKTSMLGNIKRFDKLKVTL